MRNKLMYLFASIITLTAFGVSYNLQAQDIEAIRTLEDQRYRAMEEADTIVLNNILDNSLTYTHSRGRVDSKKQYITSLTSNNLDYLLIKIEEFRARQYADCIVLNETVDMKFMANGALNETKMRVTGVYVRKNNSYRLVALQNARIE